MNKKLHDFIKEVWRFPLKQYYKSKTKNINVRILSSNYIGGCLLHDMHKPFNTPTVNTIIDDLDFIKLCKSPYKYLSIEPTFAGKSKWGFPLANIDDIVINCVHYNTFDEFKQIWIRRAKRFLENDHQEIIVIATDSQLKTAEAIHEFCNLPYRKICFIAHNHNNIFSNDFVLVPGYENKDCVGDLTKYADKFGTRIFEKHFDCIKFLNNFKVT